MTRTLLPAQCTAVSDFGHYVTGCFIEYHTAKAQAWHYLAVVSIDCRLKGRHISDAVFSHGITVSVFFATESLERRTCGDQQIGDFVEGVPGYDERSMWSFF